MAVDLKPQDRLILALDLEEVGDALELLERLGGLISIVKVNWALLLKLDGGMDLVRRLIDEYGKKVFLDLKLNDTPESVRLPLEIIGRAGVSFVTIHGNGKCLEAAIKGRTAKDLKIFAVTALTSLDAEDIREIYNIDVPLEEFVIRRVRHLIKMGCDGLITSPLEIPIIRQVVPKETLIVSPGIRLPSDQPNEHKRFADPATAIRSGADYIVVGRPIIHASDPVNAARRYIEGIEHGLKDRENPIEENPSNFEDLNTLISAVPEKKQGG